MYLILDYLADLRVRVFVIVVGIIGLCYGGYRLYPLLHPPENKLAETRGNDIKGLQSERVEDFLRAYYTRKELGANQKKYQKLMTESYFLEMVADENSETMQLYKPFNQNMNYVKAKILLDTTDLKQPIAICSVVYLEDHYGGLEADAPKALQESMTANIILSFVFDETKGEYLVTHIDGLTNEKLEELL